MPYGYTHRDLLEGADVLAREDERGGAVLAVEGRGVGGGGLLGVGGAQDVHVGEYPEAGHGLDRLVRGPVLLVDIMHEARQQESERGGNMVTCETEAARGFRKEQRFMDQSMRLSERVATRASKRTYVQPRQGRNHGKNSDVQGFGHVGNCTKHSKNGLQPRKLNYCCHLSDADGVVGEDVVHGQLRESGHTHGRAHVVGEDEEGGA